MWYKNVKTSFFRLVTIHPFDRRTDGQKGLGNTVRCITMQSHGNNYASSRYSYSSTCSSTITIPNYYDFAQPEHQF